ncbi:hypothetical protein [Pseudoclavibacter helvolus]|uniref:hypothetical protein n=1 Tax=Pseudoclavibacter helvolus TaxID=255205 RepID=UPI003C727658
MTKDPVATITPSETPDLTNDPAGPTPQRPSFDPTPGTSGPREFSKDDSARVTKALLLLVRALELITFETASDPPPQGSTADRLWRSAERGYALDGFITMQYANMSALDHVRGFVALVRTPTVRSTALATVARGAHESLARTWHLLSHSSDEDFMYRTLCFLRSDLRYSELLNGTVHTRDGDPVDPAAKRAFYAAELTRLQLPPQVRTDISVMVAAMLDAEFGDDGGREYYSDLSSIAHAHRPGLNTFVTTDDEGKISGLSAPRAVVVELAVHLIGVIHGVGRQFIAFYGNQIRHVEHMETAVRRALRTVGPVAESVWPSTDPNPKRRGTPAT